MDPSLFRGIYVIVTTPFTESLELDEAALHRTLDFCFAAGVHGVVATANASEVGYLSEDERRRTARIVVERARGQAVSVVGVSASHWRLSAAFAAEAEAMGADAIMAMPPILHMAGQQEIREHYAAISKASGLPLILQNAIGPGATPMPASLLAELTETLPNAPFVKEETAYPAQITGEIRRLGGERLKGVMGGRAGKALMEEVRQGACGTMPACEFADIHVALWRAIEAGEGPQSREIFRRLLPLLDMEGTYGIPFCKEVLRRRGVIPSAAWRQPGYRSLDVHAFGELDQLLGDVRDYMLPAYA